MPEEEKSMALQRIAYVVNVFPKFSETFIANEIVEVQRRGVAVTILSRRRPQDEVRHAVVRDNRLESLTCYEPDRFRDLLRSFQPQLIHAHFATRATETARELALATGLPYTFTAHRYDIFDRPPEDFAQRCRDAGAVITVSEANVMHMVGELHAPADNLSVIPCGVDTTQFQPVAQVAGEVPWIVCVARLHPVKNLPVLLKACALLRDRGVAFKCVVLGEGDARAQIEEQRRELNLQDLVDLPGAADQDQVRGWWQRATVGVLTSRSEGMPVSFMEALSCGVPIVGPSVGGIPEMIDHGVNGYVVPPDNPAAVAEEIETILRDPARRARMGAAARQTALNRFSVGAQVDAMLAVWNRVLRQRHAA